MTNQEINEAVARKLGYSIDSNNFDRAGHFRNHDYCTSIAAAWEMVEKMGAVGLFKTEEGHWYMVPNFGLQEDETNEWYFKAGEWGGGILADTAPMAICLAFLKLKESL